jgi:HSP20 family molecular chaperone IbpA
MNPLAPLLLTSSMMDWPISPMMETNELWRLPEAQLPALKETPGAYQVQVAAAGIKPEDITVTIDRNVLRVKGETKGERDGWEYINSVERSVQLPAGRVDIEHIEAVNDHGMMQITVPKLQIDEGSGGPRLIPIKPAAPAIKSK